MKGVSVGLFVLASSASGVSFTSNLKPKIFISSIQCVWNL